MAASLRFRLPPPLPFLLLVVCLAVPSTAEAQRAAFRINGSAPRIGVLDLATGQARDVSNDEAQVDASFTSDGRFAVQKVGGGLRVRDMSTGATVVLPVDFRPVVAHPRRAMFFGFTAASELARLDARGMARWTPCPGVQVVDSFDLDLDGAHLYVSCPSREILVIDSETGLEVRRIGGMPSSRLLAINAAGDLVLVHTDGAGNTAVDRRDPQTGLLLATRAGLPSWSGTGSRHQLLEFSCTVPPGASCSVSLIASSSLAPSRALTGGSLPLVMRTYVSPEGREGVFNYVGTSPNTTSVASWFDIASGRELGALTLPPGETVEVNVQYPPLPAALAQASVAAGAVALSWQLPRLSPAAVTYRLEAGLAPGATAVSIDLGAAASTTIPGVPPGRYYARIRAVNYNGVSAPSNEVVIDVP
ncbi:MAG: fibronectin type III domain-containing protein [Vicinamibacterales bacterium]